MLCLSRRVASTPNPIYKKNIKAMRDPLMLSRGKKPRISALAYLKAVSSLTSLRYFLRSLGPFNLPGAQKWS